MDVFVRLWLPDLKTVPFRVLNELSVLSGVSRIVDTQSETVHRPIASQVHTCNIRELSRNWTS